MSRSGQSRSAGSTAQSPSPAPALEIAVGVIVREGRVLVSRRLAGTHLAGLWELPGGKLRPGEAVVDALRREIEEETGLGFRDAVLLHREFHAYAERSVDLQFFLCLDPAGEASGREGQDVRWVTIDELERLEMPAGNRRIFEILREQLRGEG